MLGNGLVAILAGLLANYLVEGLALGPVAPFDAAMVLLAVGGVVIMSTWPENYGNASANNSLVHQFTEAINCIRNDQRVLLLGLMQVRTTHFSQHPPPTARTSNPRICMHVAL